MRILLVSDVYPPLIGGVELQMQFLGHELVRRGHLVTVVTPWQPGLSEREDDQGVTVYRIKGLASRVPWFSSDPGRRHHPPFPDPATVWGLHRVLVATRPQVIHCYGWIVYSCALALARKQIPLVLSVREYAYTCALRTMMQHGGRVCDGPGLRKCLGCAMRYYGTLKGAAAALGVYFGRSSLQHATSGVHSVSTYMRDYIVRDLFPESVEPGARLGEVRPIAVIPSFRVQLNPHPDDGAALDPYLAQLPKRPFILFVGALRLVKGIQPLLEAYRRIQSAPPLVLIGVPSPDTPKTFPENVRVLHNLPNAAVLAAWQKALFGVAPSMWPEPFGNVIHEAMSQGKAVIGTTHGGQTDLILPEVTGLLVPPGDVTALAGAMQRLIDDVQLRERLGQAARERAQQFTAEVVVPRFEQFYQLVVSTTRGKTVWQSG